ncbi:epsin-2 isoform X2 [Aethina tumida]|uniref:epsin-2 isoform X2 n=1 Tax=Aethina tumida TaxID=116153 RepID=UPI002147C0E7|nr:epsin-2 isoform X2 [Aethina tumida]
MRRGSHDMQVMNVAGIRRNLKNFAHNYSDAQKKVREATSNDPWGPSSTIMAEIADLTYNVVAFSEIMQMVWKRLNDHGRNWRHVYKALVLLEYLIKTGSEKVGQQCKENIFAIQTLKDFQYLEEGKDQGQNVREKAKQLVNLLKDDERLKNERARALKAKERFAQSASGFGSDGGLDTPSSPKYPAFRGDWNSRDSADIPREIEIARPQTAGEEELQLQLALAMSREEAEQEEQKRKSDDVRLQLALSQSQQDFKEKVQPNQSHMVDLLDVDLAPVDPWGMPQPPRPQSLDLSFFNLYPPQSSPWQSNSLSSPPSSGAAAAAADPWQPVGQQQQPRNDPWGGTASPPLPTALNGSAVIAPPQRQDPWSPTSPASSTDLDDFDAISNRNRTATPVGAGASPKTNGNATGAVGDPFELTLLDALAVSGPSPSTGATKKTPQSFLGENSALVNLDNLVTSKPANPPLAANPFSDVAPPPKPTINEIKQQQFAPFATGGAQSYGASATQFGAVSNAFASTTNGNAFGAPMVPAPAPVQDPWAPVQTSNVGASPWMKAGDPANPFLS